MIMETCVGPHTYFIFAVLFLSFSYGVNYLEPDGICAKFVASVFALAGLYVAQKLIPRGTFKPDGKAVFITGCDTGFGHALALRCDQIGLRVFAGCLSPVGVGASDLSSKSSNRLTIIPCDVTSDIAVTAASKLISETVNKEKIVFWACINNAGIQRYGEIEMLPFNIYKDILEVNTFGLVRVTKEFIPIIRENKGRFVQVTSVMARWPQPVSSPYCMSKSAADTFNDILRYEMHKWGVKVSIIHPGPYGANTNIVKFLNNDKERADFIWNGMDQATQQLYGRAYIDTIQDNKAYNLKFESNRDITPVIDAMIDAILSKHPKHRYLIGGLFAQCCWREFVPYRMLPTWLSDIKRYKQQEALGVPLALQETKKNK